MYSIAQQSGANASPSSKQEEPKMEQATPPRSSGSLRSCTACGTEGVAADAEFCPICGIGLMKVDGLRQSLSQDSGLKEWTPPDEEEASVATEAKTVAASNASPTRKESASSSKEVAPWPEAAAAPAAPTKESSSDEAKKNDSDNNIPPASTASWPEALAPLVTSDAVVDDIVVVDGNNEENQKVLDSNDDEPPQAPPVTPTKASTLGSGKADGSSQVVVDTPATVKESSDDDVEGGNSDIESPISKSGGSGSGTEVGGDSNSDSSGDNGGENNQGQRRSRCGLYFCLAVVLALVGTAVVVFWLVKNSSSTEESKVVPTPPPETTTIAPTTSDTTYYPTNAPVTPAPTTSTPTASEPTDTPTAIPTATPSVDPTGDPSIEPTSMPTGEPTTAVPSASPSDNPTLVPTSTPTETVTGSPTLEVKELIIERLIEGGIQGLSIDEIANLPPQTSSILDYMSEEYNVVLALPPVTLPPGQGNGNDDTNATQVPGGDDTGNDGGGGGGVRGRRGLQQQNIIVGPNPEVVAYEESLVQRYAMLNLDWKISGYDGSSGFVNLPTIASRQFVNECEWDGVTCSNTDNTVTRLKWGHRVTPEISTSIPNVNAHIGTEIGLLQNLKYLDLSSNQLGGIIPDELYQIAGIEKVYLFKNQLGGTISSSVGDLWSLHTLHLSHNQIQGSIPPEIRSGQEIRPLHTLNLYSNQMTGSFPESTRLRNLFLLDLGRNQFSGPLPADFADKAVSLRIFHINHNQFSGEIPMLYSQMGNGRVVSYAIDNNNFTGEPPVDNFRNGNVLVQYTMHKNDFTQSIDRSFCQQNVFQGGEMVEMKADCNVCSCNNIFCDMCIDS